MTSFINRSTNEIYEPTQNKIKIIWNPLDIKIIKYIRTSEKKKYILNIKGKEK